MTDTERIDALERLIWSDTTANGLVIFPVIISCTGERRVALQDLGDEDGSNLGEELTAPQSTLRDAIDEACSVAPESEAS